MAGVTIAAAALSLLRTFKDPIINALGDVKIEVIHSFNQGLERYIHSFYSKFKTTKTFLFRNEEIPFYDIYFPTTLEIKKKTIVIKKIEDLYRNDKYSLILGYAGSGKSMLMKHLFLLAIEQKVKIPILIELRSLNEFEGSITKYIYEKILLNKLSPSEKIMERIMEKGHFIFLLDGFDEIYSEHEEKIRHDLEFFIDKYYLNFFVISSRPGSGIESFPRFNLCKVQNLSDSEIKEFIDKQCKANKEPELAVNILQALESKENDTYKHYLSSPLLLSMLLFTFRNYPELPDKRCKFYWNVFDTLMTKHDSFSKGGGWMHQRESGLQYDDIEKILYWFSYTSYFDEKYYFDEEYCHQILRKIRNHTNIEFNIWALMKDLTVNIGIFQLDGVQYKYPHRSMQEYFTVKLISGFDNDKKKIIYEKYHEYLDFGPGGHINFWKICQEIDFSSFSKFVIVPRIEMYLNDLDLLKQTESIFFFIGLLNIKVVFSKKDLGKYKFERSFLAGQDFVLLLELLSFNFGPILAKINNILDSTEFYNIALPRVHKLFNKFSYYRTNEFHVNHFDKSPLLRYLNEKQFYKIVLEVEIFLRGKKNEINKEISDSDDNIMALI